MISIFGGNSEHLLIFLGSESQLYLSEPAFNSQKVIVLSNKLALTKPRKRNKETNDSTPS